MDIPAAWSESDEGSRSLVASIADARAEFEPPADGKSEGFLMVHENGHHQGLLLSADGARAAVAVLIRWLAESAPAVAEHPPATIEAELPEGFEKISGVLANYRGWRYLLADRKWHRTHQIQEVAA